MTTDTLATEVQIAAYDDANLEVDVKAIGTMKAAMVICGGLSSPSKMPGFAYNLPADKCKVGSILRKRKGSTCHGCYAATTVEWQKQGGRMMVGEDGVLRGSRYPSATVQTALNRRFGLIGHDLWVPAMVVMIRGKRESFFRWHDSGDIQSAAHLANIFAVCRATPNTQHWLPTRERAILVETIKLYGEPPDNLLIRASAAMVDGPRPRWDHASTVTSKHDAKGGHLCPSSNQGNQCGDCRACWSKDVPTVVYAIH